MLGGGMGDGMGGGMGVRKGRSDLPFTNSTISQTANTQKLTNKACA